MKKKFLLFIAVLFSVYCNAQSGVALASKQTTQIVAADTANARLQKILTSVRSNSAVTASFSTTALTLTSSSVTTSGSVTSGAKTVIFEFSNDFVGTVDGISGSAGTSLTFSAGSAGTLPAISYAISAGNIRIRKLQ